MRKDHSKFVNTAAAIVTGLLALSLSVSAQLPVRQYLYSSASIVDTYHNLLHGTNPSNTSSNGCDVISGCVVQILIASSGVAHLPNLDGTPGGGDSNVFQTAIGVGEDLCSPENGQFAGSFSPAPPNGTKIYARVFNAPTLAQATEWAQSANFTVDGKSVMDVSALGAEETTMPKGIDLNTIDPKGQTFYFELVANTDPQNPNDVFAAGVLPNSGSQQFQVSVSGHSGRIYTLQRDTNDLATAGWTDIASNAMLSADSALILADPSPPHSSKAFYRLKVTMP